MWANFEESRMIKLEASAEILIAETNNITQLLRLIKFSFIFTGRDYLHSTV